MGESFGCQLLKQGVCGVEGREELWLPVQSCQILS